MKKETWQELIHSLGKADSIESLHGFCCSLCENYGFDNFIFATSIPTSFIAPQTCVFTSYPKEWRDHYTEQGYFAIDPTVAHCARHVIPLSWEAIRPLERKAGRCGDSWPKGRISDSTAD